MRKLSIALFIGAMVCLAGCGKEESVPDTTNVVEEASEEQEVASLSLLDYDYNDYVTLGEYKGISLEVTPVVVTDEDVERECNAIVSENTTYEPTDKTVVEVEDWIVASWSVEADGESLDAYSATEQRIHVGSGYVIQELEEAFVGLTVGEETVKEVTIASDFQDSTIAGKTLTFTITVSSILEEKAPTVDDVWVSTLQEYDTVDEWKQGIRATLEESAKLSSDENARSRLQQAVINNCEFKEPPTELVDALFEEQKESDSSTAESYGMEFADYVSMYYGVDESGYDEAMRQEVKNSINVSFMLLAIADAEGLQEVSEEDVNTFVEENYEYYGFDSAEAMIEFYGESVIKEACKSNLVWDFIFDSANFVEAAAEQE